MASPTTPTIPPPSNPTCKTTTTTTTTTISTSTSLAASPHLSPLTTLINTTFAHSHAKHPLLIPPSQLRLSTPQQLLSELGPNGFTLIIHSSATDPSPIATVSCKPWAPPDASKPAALTNAVAAARRKAATLAAAPAIATTAAPTHETAITTPTPDEAALFRSSQRPSTPPSASSSPNTTAPDPALPAWEFFAMAVSPHHQSRGLASQLLSRVVEEVRARSVVAVPGPVTADNGDGNGNDVHDYKNKDGGEVEASSGEVGRMGKVRLRCSTARAFNEGFYLKKGFRTTRRMWVERGVYGSEEGFEVVDMEMVV